ncbi:sulfite exporter TauE/SafE family protein [Ghiorsea bivora]|uniref:sulfite exporter TauE/SafE family protein n=1 Tax=Ghiorsea bivora TaxID=1485545 RepID=UPI000570A4C3|nr:sulfite exporter TauE/SafE family protein [Ghiorsea bivora]
MFEQALLFAIALIANTFSALAGGGAGLIQLPALLLLGLPFSIALATHKIASVALGLGAVTRYLKEDLLQRKLALLMLVSGLPGVVIGGFIIVNIPDDIATAALGLLTMMLGFYSMFSPKLGLHYQPKNMHIKGLMIGGAALFGIGILNGSLTSGTGLFVTLFLIRWFGLDYKHAVAYTLVMVGVFWNGAGAVTVGLLSDIQWSWLIALLLGSFIGGYLGSHLAILKGNALIKRSYEIITILIGLQLLFG